MSIPDQSVIKKILEGKLADFQLLCQLDPNNKWDLYRQSKGSNILVHLKYESKSKSTFVRCEKTLNFPASKVFQLLWNDLNAYQHFDERQAKLFLLSKYSDFLRICYYFLKSERPDILNHADMLMGMQGIHEKSGVYSIIACSINSEMGDFPIFDKTSRMECNMLGFVIKPNGENKCSIIQISNKKMKDRVPSVLANAYDWDRGHFMEKLERYLTVYPSKSDEILNPTVDFEIIQDYIKSQSKDSDENSIKRNEWFEKFREMLKPTETDFTNIENVDLYYLYGEPFVEKKRKLFGLEDKKSSNKEFLKAFMTKTKR